VGCPANPHTELSTVVHRKGFQDWLLLGPGFFSHCNSVAFSLILATASMTSCMVSSGASITC
jgi:hypothetical protein